MVTPEGNASRFVVGGRVLDEAGAAVVAGVAVEVLDLRLGGAHPIGTADVGPDGTFVLAFDPDAARSAPGADLDLVVHVVRAPEAPGGRAAPEVLARSAPRFDAGPYEIVDVVVPAAAVPAVDEYTRVVSGIARSLRAAPAAAVADHAGPAALADLVEDDDRRDVTFVAAKTGQDARAVAMVALAGRESADTGIPAPLHYALYRAGLPAGERLWALAPGHVLRGVWEGAVAQGVVAPELADEVPASLDRAAELADAAILALPTGVGDDRLADLLRHAVPDDDDRARFLRLYREHRDDPATLWAHVRDELDGDTADRLRLDGALAALTRNNVTLIGKLHDGGRPAGRLGQVGDLAAAGFHRAERWRAELTDDVAVPDDVPGDDDAARRDAYAALLAEELRLRHPTAVLGAEVADGTVPVAAPPDTRNAVAGFLAAHDGRFAFAVQPVADFLGANGVDLDPPARAELEALQRVSAVAAGPHAVRGMRALGLDSARAVAGHGESAFVARFGAELGGDEAARETFRRSQQVSLATLAMATDHLVARAAPEVFAIPPGGPAAGSGPGARALAAVAAVGTLPTLETLFGPGDAGACTHCESVLSPAAYFVDLLEFLDVPGLPAGRPRPQQVLFARRPDLEHLALSCENTEVELPYVDVVNEILEYVVVNSSIAGYAGHDVPEGVDPAELLASPRHVDDAAYAVLRGAAYPLVLPWDQRLAALRAYLAQTGPTLHAALIALGPDATPGRTWRDVAGERLGVGPAERDVLCGPGVSAQALYGDDPTRVSDDQLVAGAASARRLTRRFGLTPTELVAVVRTWFLNPDLPELSVLLAALRVSRAQIRALRDGTLTPAQFRAAVAPGLDPAPYGGDVAAWVLARHDRIMDIVVLTDTTGQEPAAGDSTGGWAAMELRRALPDSTRNRLRPVDLLGIARFVRLRARLGWSVERTDGVLHALWPAARTARDDRPALDAGFTAVLERLGHLLTAADLLGLDVDAELPSLLGCVAPLGVDGPDAPFRRMFPGAAGGPDTLGTDPVFGPGPDGRPPARSDALLLDHGPALQAALTLTADEFAVAIRDAGVDATTRLSVASVSALFRRAYLARALQLSVAELADLRAITGWDPFTVPDGPDPDLLRTVRLALLLRGSGLTVARLAALVRGPQTPAAQPDTATLALLRALRAGLTGPAEPAGGRWTEATLRTLLGTVYPPDVVDSFLGLLAGTDIYTTPYRQQDPTLPDAILALAPRLAYDAARGLLLHRGAPAPGVAEAVAALPGLPAGLAEAVARLVNAAQAHYLPLLRAHPVLAQRWAVWAATPDDPADPDGEARRAALGVALRNALAPDVARLQLRELLAAATGAEPAIVAVLLDDPDAVSGSAPGRPLADDLVTAAATGLTARFWAGPVAGPPATTAVAATLDYGPGAGDLRAQAGIAAGPVAGTWSGALDPPVFAPHTLTVEADAASVTLAVDGASVPLTRNGSTWTSTAPVDLVAGRLVTITVAATGLDARITLRWRAEGVAPGAPPRAVFCPADAVAAVAVALRRLRTALELASALDLSARELRALARAPRHRVGGVGWLSALPVDPVADPQPAPALVDALAALARYRVVRERWEVADDVLADLLDPGPADLTAPPAPPSAVVAQLAGVDAAAVEAAAAHVGAGADGLRDGDVLYRLADVLDLVRRVALPVPTLARALLTTPSAQDVRDVRDAVRARYDAAAWATVVRPVHDGLRRASREALVGRVLHVDNPDPDLADPDQVTGGYTSPDQLYEKLLIDVSMDPCMTTSRIVSAVSTVQLFVARCLLNLEPDVAPQAIDAQRWEAMRRYRVWEANRKVFLFPENWLDPELRDDKSPFFRDVETELLQSDITDQAAATALGHYLEKLDEVASLEIAGLHVDERVAPGDVPDPVVHVVGRTAGAKRGYFHRTLDGTWRPWEAVNVDVQDDPVLPVMWKGRFLLFWLKIAKQPDATQPGPFTPGAPADTPLNNLTIRHLSLKATATLTVSLFWSEYYNGRWQSPRTSDPDRPIDLGAKFSVVGDPQSLRLASEIVVDATGIRDSLGVIVLNPDPGGTGNSYFRLYTTHSLPVRKQDDLGGSLGFPADRQFSTSGPFVVTYSDDPFDPLTVLRADRSPYRGMGPMHRLRDPHRAPFFFQDSRHVFYVHPAPTGLPPAPPFGVFPGPVAAAPFAPFAPLEPVGLVGPLSPV